MSGRLRDVASVAARTDYLFRSGMSPAYGGILSALDVRYSLTPVENKPSLLGTWGVSFAKKGKYLEKETIYAVYPDKRDLLVSETRELFLD